MDKSQTSLTSVTLHPPMKALKNTHFKMHNEEKSYKCNQRDFASSEADNFRTHLKSHSGEKSNKCNQCDYASFKVSNLRTHLKTHSGEKSNKCNQCNFATAQAGDLKRHLKTHLEKGQTNATCVILHPLRQVF